jgi:hypothetical protein
VTGSSNTVAFNSITTDYYGYKNLGAWNESVRGVGPYSFPIKFNQYLVAKYVMGVDQVASYDYGVEIGHGTNNVVLGNHIYQGLGVGVQIGDGANANNYPLIVGTQVVSNNIETQTSIGVLTSEGETMTYIYGNSFSDSDINVRYHHINVGGEVSRIVYVFRNTFYLPDKLGQHIYFHGSSTVTGRYLPQFYTYNNSFSGGDGCLEDNGNIYPENGMANSQFLNNVFNGWYFASSDSTWQLTSWMGPFDYNLVGPPKPTYPSSSNPVWWLSHNITASSTIWANAAGMNFNLSSNSPAIGQAIDITTNYTINGITYPPLPSIGFTKVGSAYDMGAVEYGAGGASAPLPPTNLHVVGSP